MEETIVVGSRASSEHEVAPGSRRTPCSRCGQGTWVAPSSRALLESGARVICLDCFAETYQGGQIMVQEKTLEEVEEITGRPLSMAEATWMVAQFMASHGKGGRG